MIVAHKENYAEEHKTKYRQRSTIKVKRCQYLAIYQETEIAKLYLRYSVDKLSKHDIRSNLPSKE